MIYFIKCFVNFWILSLACFLNWMTKIIWFYFCLPCHLKFIEKPFIQTGLLPLPGYSTANLNADLCDDITYSFNQYLTGVCMTNWQPMINYMLINSNQSKLPSFLGIKVSQYNQCTYTVFNFAMGILSSAGVSVNEWRWGIYSLLKYSYLICVLSKCGRFKNIAKRSFVWNGLFTIE